MRPPRPRIVIVGGGFAGVYAATHLTCGEFGSEELDVLLIDQRNHFVFTPLLSEVVGGALGREHVTVSYRTLARQLGFRFHQKRIVSLDLAARVVLTNTERIPWDYLILAIGAEPTFFGNEALRRASVPFASAQDAIALHDRAVAALEAGSVLADDRGQRRLTFAIAGAGPAGVEVAGELHHLTSAALRPYFPDAPESRVHLVSAIDRILPGFDSSLADRALAELRGRGVNVALNTRVLDVVAAGVVVETGGVQSVINADTLIWTAGTRPSGWLADMGLTLERGAVRVRNTLQVEAEGDEYQTVFAVGDAAALCDSRSGAAYPRVAPIAISQGIRAAANVENHLRGRPLEPYHAHHAGSIVALGHGVALADVLGFQLRGRLAWWLYRMAYLLKLIGSKNKVRVLLTLATNRLFEPDVGTGESWHDEPTALALVDQAE